MRKGYGCFCRYMSTCLLSPNGFNSQGQGPIFIQFCLSYNTQHVASHRQESRVRRKKGRGKHVVFVRVWKYLLIFRGLINNLPNTWALGKTEEGRAC